LLSGVSRIREVAEVGYYLFTIWGFYGAFGSLWMLYRKRDENYETIAGFLGVFFASLAVLFDLLIRGVIEFSDIVICFPGDVIIYTPYNIGVLLTIAFEGISLYFAIRSLNPTKIFLQQTIDEENRYIGISCASFYIAFGLTINNLYHYRSVGQYYFGQIDVLSFWKNSLSYFLYMLFLFAPFICWVIFIKNLKSPMWENGEFRPI